MNATTMSPYHLIMSIVNAPLEEEVVYTVISVCAECDEEIGRRTVSQETFIAMRNRAWAYADRYGEDDYAPEFGETTCKTYKSVCNPCRKWLSECRYEFGCDYE